MLIARCGPAQSLNGLGNFEAGNPVPALALAADGTVAPPWASRVVREPYFLDEVLRALSEIAPSPPDHRTQDAQAPSQVNPGPMNDVLRGLAHAINNPLTAAVGWLRLLSLDGITREKQQDLVGQAQRELDVIARMTLAMTALGGRNLRHLGLVRVCDAVAAATRDVPESQVRLRCVGANTLSAVVHTDAAIVELMIGLLTHDARADARPEPLEIEISSTPAHVRISLRDVASPATPAADGFGIASLLRTQRHTRGLGMALAAELACRSGGTLQCEGAAPAGSTLVLILPVVTTALEQEGDRA